MNLVPDWQVRRCAFNHDWLINVYQKRVKGFWKFISGGATEDSPNYAWDFLRDVLPQWEARRPDAEWLLRHFSQDMSPSRLLEMPRLSKLNAATKTWLKPAIHYHWMLTQQVTAKLARATKALNEVDQIYAETKTALGNFCSPISDAELRSLGPQIRKLADALGELGDAISAFTPRIVILSQ